MHGSELKKRRMKKTENEHDRFYSSIAEFYSGIFPLNPAQVAFIEGEWGTLENKNLLDVGCGSGELAFTLSGKGASVTAIDLNDALLNVARKHHNQQGIKWLKADMLHLKRLFGSEEFDGVICFGNTLVHLLTQDKMQEFFSGAMAVLKPGGLFFLQILNYDYIFREHIGVLPVIENDLIRFDRTYKFIPGSREIRFCTKLTIQSSEKEIVNETCLLGIGTNDLMQLLAKAGFSDVQLFSDFRKTPVGGDHLPLVMRCKKNTKKGNL
jgi:glycine/sarcosine N-methyltransferase